LLALRPRIFPQFATHNALTVATVLELAAPDAGGFEFQRLHGMGDALYAKLSEDRPGIAYRTYAPVGSHRDLLAYLVRRLLENGANSSFVALSADDAVPVTTLLRRPAEIVRTPDNAAHPNIPLPRELFSPHRKNSRGLEFGERAALGTLVAAIAAEEAPAATSMSTSMPWADPTRWRPRLPWRTSSRTIAMGSRADRPPPSATAAPSLTRDREGRRPPGTAKSAFHRVPATRGRQDTRRCALRGARGRRFLPLLR